MTIKWPAIPDPTLDPRSLRDSVLAMKQAFEILTGARGSGDYKALLSGDDLTVAEEGSFTPSFTFTTPGNLSVTYSAQFGHYVKINRLVIAWFNITTSAFTHSTASGNCVFSSLPYTPVTEIIGNSIGLRGASLTYSGVTKAGYTSAVLLTDAAGARTWTIQFSGSGVATSTLAAADMPTGGSVVFRGVLMYLTDE